ncbi:MAG: zinc ribbon domain-containing protein [Acidobacteria bacterium]|nr:zinc ribbon domain-containing protein [Acidobacteriota bacterium]
MPLYEYRCEACGTQEEALESFSAPTEHACSACGAGQGMKRQLSKAGFVLAGGGWYDSGYGSESPQAASGAGAGASKAESKPATSTESAPAVASPASSAPTGGCGGGCSCH